MAEDAKRCDAARMPASAYSLTPTRNTCATLAVSVLLVTSCSTRTPAPRAVPPSSASPVAVVAAYLAAAKAHDCTLTRTLTLTQFTNYWCRGSFTLLDYRDIGPAEFHPGTDPQVGRDEECVPFELDPQGVPGPGIPAGWQRWSLCLIRTSSGWRIWDQHS